MAVRSLMAAAAVAAMMGAAWVLSFGPQQTGALSGICRDKATGKPIANAQIWIYPQQLSANSQASSPAPNHGQGPPEDALGRTDVPAGWHEGYRTTDPSSELTKEQDQQITHVRSDKAGAYRVPRLLPGVYSLSAESPAYNGNARAVIYEGAPSRVNISMSRNNPFLNFEVSGKTFTPRDSPRLGLNGLLQKPHITLTLYSMDIPRVMRQHPGRLLSPGDSTPWDPDDWRLIRTWGHDIKKHGSEGSFYERIQMDPLPEGIYWLTAASPETNGSVWFRVTRLGLISKSVGQKFVAFVVDVASGKALRGVQVGLWPNSGARRFLSRPRGAAAAVTGPIAAISRAVTGIDGLARLSSAGAAGESGGILLARQGNSTAAVAAELNSPGSSSESSYAGQGYSPQPVSRSRPHLLQYVYTDRPIYRPGDTVYIKGLTRVFAPGGRFDLPGALPVRIEVRDPRDTLVYSTDRVLSTMGSWWLSMDINPEALTGDYTVKAQCAGNESMFTFTVAAYRKPVYEVKVTLSKDRYIRGDRIIANISAAYFFGSPVSLGKVQCQVYRSSADLTDMEGGYSDPSDNTQTYSESEEEAGELVLNQMVQLDANGQARLVIPTVVSSKQEGQNNPGSGDISGEFTVGYNTTQSSGDLYDSDNEDPGDETYRIEAVLDDQTGIQATGTAVAEVAQGEFSLSTNVASSVASAGSTVPVVIKATDQHGAAVTGQKLTVEAFYEAWSEDKIRRNPAGKATTITGTNGVARVSFSARSVGLLIVRAKATDSRGNHISSRTEVWVVGAGEEIPAPTGDLSLVVDKKRYQPDDTARILINTRHPGVQALVTVEGGDLYQTLSVALKHESTAIEIPVRRIYAPSVTLSVAIIVNKNYQVSTSNLVVGNDQRVLDVTVKSDRAVYAPGDSATLTVTTSDPQGHPVAAEASVGLVDAAVYAVKPESREPIGHAFMPEQGNLVQTQYSCFQVYLGDVDKGASTIHIRKRFPDTAVWRPHVLTGPRGKAVITFQVPDSLTTWKATCIAITASSRVGEATTSLKVTKPLQVRMEPPAFLVVGDESKLAVVIQNETGAPQHTRVQANVSGLEVTDGIAGSVLAPADQPTRLWLSVRATRVGQAHIILTVISGSLNDAMEVSFPVEPHGSGQDQWDSGSLIPRTGSSKSETSVLTVSPKAILNATELTIHLAPTAGSSIASAIEYLAGYPYGSTDSTASILLADSIVLKMRTAGMEGSDAVGMARSDLTDASNRAILRLARFQADDGSWGWWDNTGGDLWMTACAVHALCTAHDAGLRVDPGMIQRGGVALAQLSQTERTRLARQKNEGQSEDWIWHSYCMDLSYAALPLAESGQSIAAMQNIQTVLNWWDKHPNAVSMTDMAKIAIASRLCGPRGLAVSDELMTHIMAVRRETGALCAWPENPRRSDMGVQQAPVEIEPTAWVLMAMQAAQNNSSIIDKTARWLMTSRTGGYWYSPDTTAVVASALADYASRTNEMQPNFWATLTVNGTPVKSLHFDRTSIGQPEQVVRIPGTDLHSGPNQVTIEQQGTGVLFYSIQLHQCVREPDPAPPMPFWKRWWLRVFDPQALAAPHSKSGYRIKRVYVRTTARKGLFWQDSVPVREDRFRTNEDVVVRLIIDSVRAGSRLIVEEPIPSGFDVQDVAGDQEQRWDNWWTYTDVRSDKMVFFIDDMTRGRHEIDYHLRARRQGRYDVMAASISSVFDPTLHVVGKTNRIWVSQGEEP